MPSFLHWLDSNWQAVCGWCTGIYLTYRVGKFFTDIVLKVKSVVERFEAAESTLVSVATNHLPHLQMELRKNQRDYDQHGSDTQENVQATSRRL